jgi:outer membrane biosynthesis protein TonB
MVWRTKDLLALNPKFQVARIAHTVGENKRVQIIDEAKKANIRVLNPGLKKPAEALPEVPAEPTVAEPTPSEPTPETKEEEKAATEEKEPQPTKKKPKKKAKPKATTKGKRKE